MSLQSLPAEVFALVLVNLAQGVGLPKLLHGRLVSKAFDRSIMDGFVFARVVHYTDIVKYDDKATIVKYLDWHLHHEPADTTNMVDMFRDVTNTFMRKSAGKYNYKLVSGTLQHLYADELVRQRLQYQEALTRRPPCHSYSVTAPMIWWCSYDLQPYSSNHIDVNHACLCIASALDDKALVASLAPAGIEMSYGYEDFLYNSLQAAMSTGNGPMTKYLVGCEYEYLLFSSSNWTSLKDAIISHAHEILDFLLAPIDGPTSGCRELRLYKEAGSPLQGALVIACQFDNRHAFDAILANMNQPLSLQTLQAVLFAACEGRSFDLAQWIFTMYPGLNANFSIERSRSPPMLAAAKDDIYPIQEAARFGQYQLIELLLKHGAEPNVLSRGMRTPLEHAAWYGYDRCITLLMDARASYDGCFDLVCNYTVRSGNPAALRRCLERDVGKVSRICATHTPGTQKRGRGQVDAQTLTTFVKLLRRENLSSLAVSEGLSCMRDIMMEYGIWIFDSQRKRRRLY